MAQHFRVVPINKPKTRTAVMTALMETVVEEGLPLRLPAIDDEDDWQCYAPLQKDDKSYYVASYVVAVINPTLSKLSWRNSAKHASF